MPAATVAGVYASALLEVARERGSSAVVVAACRDLAGGLAPETLRALDNPKVGKVRAKQVFAEVLAAQPKELRDLIGLLIDRNRLADAPAILAEVIRLAEVADGVIHVQLTTATRITPELRDIAVNRIKAKRGTTAVLDERVDPSLIGGFTSRVGDEYLDASVRRRLIELKKTIESTPVGDALWSA